MKHRDCEYMCHREGGWIHVVDCCAQVRRGETEKVVVESAPPGRTLTDNMEQNFTLLRTPRE